MLKLIVVQSEAVHCIPDQPSMPWHTAQLDTFVATAPGAPKFALDALELLIRRAAMVGGGIGDFVGRANGRVALDAFLVQRTGEMDGAVLIEVGAPHCRHCGIKNPLGTYREAE